MIIVMGVMFFNRNKEIENNVINALGHTYIYGIILSGEHFNINNNVNKLFFMALVIVL